MYGMNFQSVMHVKSLDFSVKFDRLHLVTYTFYYFLLSIQYHDMKYHLHILWRKNLKCILICLHSFHFPELDMFQENFLSLLELLLPGTKSQLPLCRVYFPEDKSVKCLQDPETQSRTYKMNLNRLVSYEYIDTIAKDTIESHNLVYLKCLLKLAKGKLIALFVPSEFFGKVFQKRGTLFGNSTVFIFILGWYI